MCVAILHLRVEALNGAEIYAWGRRRTRRRRRRKVYS